MQSLKLELHGELMLEDINAIITSVILNITNLQHSHLDSSNALDQFKDMVIKDISRISNTVIDIYMRLESQKKMNIASAATLSQ